MWQAVGNILAGAVGVAISPLPIIAVILMLVSERARGNSLSLLAGWVAGLVVICVVVLAIGGAGTGGRESTGSGIAKLVFGVLLLLLAVRRWRQRNSEAPPRVQRLLARVTLFGAGKSFVLGGALATLNPKNLALTAAAAVTVSAASLSAGGEVGALAIFIAIASCTVAAPVVVYFVLGARAAEPLDQVRGWLVAHGSAIAMALFLVFGAKLVGEGIAILV